MHINEMCYNCLTAHMSLYEMLLFQSVRYIKHKYIEMEMCELLKRIGLWNHFPGKLQRIDLFSANKCTEYSFDSGKSQAVSNLRWLKYVNGIVHFDANSRFDKGLEQTSSNSYKEKRKTIVKQYRTNSEFHPLDISTAVFLCCDYISRQDLVFRNWLCKHAFPVVIKTEQLEPPMLYMWPMKCLHSSSSAFDKPILEYEMKAVSALSFSIQDYSKSNFLNLIISKTEKVQSAFFHRDCTGSTKQKSKICEGMIETLPVLDSKYGPVWYFNLRGKCGKHREQRQFLVKISDVIILLCKTDDIKRIRDFATNDLECTHAILIIVFTDLDANDDNDSLHLKIEHFSGTLPVRNYVVPLKNLSHPDLIDDIWKILKESKTTCNQDKLILSARSNYLEVDLDYIEETLKTTASFGAKTVKSFRETSLFPLQGDESMQWSRTEFEICKLRHWERHGTEETVRHYREKLESQKVELRLKQMQKIQNNEIWIIKEFIEKIDISQKGKGLDLEILLRGLKLHFDRATRSSLRKICNQFVALIDQHKIEKSSAIGIEEQLQKIDKSYNNMYLSLNMFTREMGQIFETIVSQREKMNIPDTLMPETLAQKAVALLINGYQVELMDGRTNDVPIKWIQSVLLELHKHLKRVRIKVITVLGVQSSGKSTLLNIMFGSQFDVSSGRCTRGVNMHLVKVSTDVAEEYSVDYLIILDTEGLFSTNIKWDQGERSHEERELATFVIGLSHITILNIMGENISYLSDILPISVRAFLRMELAGLNSKCVLLRHGVDATQKDKMRRQTYSLENALDSFTSAACDLEGVPRRRFKNIIRFDIAEDDYYFPSLNAYSNEVETINPSYSKAAMQLKQNLLTDQDARGTILEFRSHINSLWRAIKRDNFVYDFRNTIEMEARAVMDKRICYLQWQIRRELQKNTAFFKAQIANCENISDLLQIESNYHAYMRKMANEQQHFNHEELYFDVQNPLLSKSIQKLREPSLQKLKNAIDECRLTCNTQFERDLSYRKTEMKLLENDERLLNQIDEFIQRNLATAKLTKEEISTITNTLFERWCDTVWTNQTHPQHFKYEEDASDCIFATYFTHRANVDSILQEKSIMERNMNDFLREMPTRKWFSNVVHSRQDEMAQDIVQDSLNYVEHMINEVIAMKIFYHTDIFRDILLEVGNHKHLYSGKIHIKPSCEIELAISLCGEFIRRVQAFDTDKTLLSKRLMEKTESYFKSKCRAQFDYETNTFEAVKSFTDIITEGLQDSIVKGLPQEIASHLKEKHFFLASKQGLFCHTLITLLDRNDALLGYIISPVTGVEGCISSLFDELLEDSCADQVNQIQAIIVKSVEKYLGDVRERLLKASQNLEVHKRSTHSSAMMTCVDIIYDSLNELLTLNKIRVFAHDRLNEPNAGIIISRLAENFNELQIVSTLTKKLNELVLKAQLDRIRHESVREVLEDLLGCKATCPFCGELCCIGQEGHKEEHKTLMHKPAAFQELISGTLSRIHPDTCWDECEKLRSCEKESIKNDWIIPTDVTAEDNSFWKFMFTAWIESNTSEGTQETIEIPSSWKMLSRSAEKEKLTIMMERISEL